ncbi:hypothetical protein ACYFX5_08970 [Bremerella sp. T1]|uniref:hypothetical protein n=1 Tax=Bremerella sp. TYQ1 TaxID=3119568 RepID=UPI001CCF6953|nr:hypothetical protein [Bremerella volcania]UBM38385.1 hypothetical protein LA756_10900 [Bremerella volcania]
MGEKFVIGDGSNQPEIKPGQHVAKFKGLEPITEGQFGPYRPWVFEGEDGTIYKGFCNVPKSGPKTNNQLGRWLCGLAGKPLAAGQEIEPDAHIGQRYMLFYGEKDGKVKLQAITKM